MQVQSVSNVQNLGFAKNYNKIGNSIATDSESAPIQEASSENYRANFAPNFKSRRVQPKYVYNLKVNTKGFPRPVTHCARSRC